MTAFKKLLHYCIDYLTLLLLSIFTTFGPVEYTNQKSGPVRPFCFRRNIAVLSLFARGNILFLETINCKYERFLRVIYYGRRESDHNQYGRMERVLSGVDLCYDSLLVINSHSYYTQVPN